jgi:heterodisulfide reductase subunit D
VKMAQHANVPAEQRRGGVEGFRKVARDVQHISRMQLDDKILERLGQKPDNRPEPDVPPDFVFYTGCNVLKTPHIALLALDIMDRLAITYKVMGGPTHCCGVVQMRTGDVATSGRFAEATMDKLAASKTKEVLAWCPSCHTQFTETTLPTIEKTRGSKPFEMTPFMLFLRRHLDRLRPHLRKRVEMRVALHRHPGIKGVVEAAEDILRAVPGVELIDLKQPAVGMMSNYFRALPAYRRELQKNELDAAERAGIDALVAVYHADHRELCAHERDYPFRIMNMLEVVGDSMDIHHDDHFKRLKLLQDADAIAADCQDLIAQHGLDAATTRQAIQAMLDEQPLPLRGARARPQPVEPPGVE